MIVDIFATDKKYSVIYADPPWKYGSKQPFTSRGGRGRFLKLDDAEYPTVPTSEMCGWNVRRIADTDCALFMWSTDSHIPDSIELMKAWGFRYVTIAFVWMKVTNKGNPVANLSQWTMKGCELCLLGTKGRMHRHKIKHNIRQVFTAERTRHSKKPDCVYGFIEDMFGEVPRIELFARQTKSGWDCWGNEVNT